MPSLTIPNFITGELGKMGYGGLLLGFYLLLLFFLSFLTFILPAMVLNRKKFSEAFY